jgi:hypothetical protein
MNRNCPRNTWSGSAATGGNADEFAKKAAAETKSASSAPSAQVARAFANGCSIFRLPGRTGKCPQSNDIFRLGEQNPPTRLPDSLRAFPVNATGSGINRRRRFSDFLFQAFGVFRGLLLPC